MIFNLGNSYAECHKKVKNTLNEIVSLSLKESETLVCIYFTFV